MKRAQLEHLIRAAGAITGSRRLIVLDVERRKHIDALVNADFSA